MYRRPKALSYRVHAGTSVSQNLACRYHSIEDSGSLGFVSRVCARKGVYSPWFCGCVFFCTICPSVSFDMSALSAIILHVLSALELT